MEWHAAACAVARDAGLSDLEAVAAANGAGRWLDIGDRADAAADAAAAEAAWTMAVQSANAAAPLAERAEAHRASLILAANRSAALARLGHFEAAEAGFAEALRLSHFAVDGTVALRIAENRVRMLLKQREVEAAHQLVTLSLAQGESVGAKAPLADLHDRAAEVCEALGDLPAAMQHLRRGAQLRSEVATRRRIAIDLHTTQTERIHAGRLSALGQVSAEMVHEMNQPLGALRMLLDNACAMLGDDRVGDALSNLHRVAQLVDRLGRLTRQINLFTHKTPVRTAAVPLRQAIDLSLMALAHRQQDLSVQVDVLVSPPDLAVRADEARLEQVLVNLLGNAFDAVSGKPARRVHILGSQVGDRCLVSIADSGPGIRLDMLSALFEPFATSKQAGAGLGLGLTIARHIVGEFGGSLRGNNRPAGGAEFTIDLPLAERHLGGPS
jgi:C4-dicarboxylate-specific signal transduction histidine kinase